MQYALSAGVEGFTTQEDQEMLSRIEKQLKRRFAIGSQVSEHSIIQDFVKQVSYLREREAVGSGLLPVDKSLVLAVRKSNMNEEVYVQFIKKIQNP